MKTCDDGCAIFKNKEYYKVKKGDFLFMEADEMNFIYFIKEGVVKLSKITLNGNERIVDIKKETDYIGLVNIIKNTNRYIVSGVAVTDCVLARVDLTTAKNELLSGNQCLLSKCLESAASRIQINDELNIEDDLNVKVTNSLNYLYKKFGQIENGEKVINLRITKNDLAGLVGVRRETLSRKLSSFVDDGFIELRKNKIIFLKNSVL